MKKKSKLFDSLNSYAKAFARLKLLIIAAGIAISSAQTQAEQLTYYVGIDQHTNLNSYQDFDNSYVGQTNPNYNRLTFLFAHWMEAPIQASHFHGRSIYFYTGPISSPTVVNTTPDNILPETYTGYAGLGLRLAASGPYAGKLTSYTYEDQSEGSLGEYSGLTIASTSALQAITDPTKAEFWIVRDNKGTNPNGTPGTVAKYGKSMSGVELGYKLVDATAGLHLGIGSNTDVGIGNVADVGGGTSFRFTPTYWVETNAAPGVYTATLQLVDLNSATTGVLPSGFFKFNFVVQPAAVAPNSFLTQGHTDIDISYDDPVFSLGISHGEPEQDFDVNDTALVALAAAHTTVPTDPNFSFLGTPGSDLWILPQVQNTNLLFLGFGAEDIAPGTFLNDQLTMKLVNTYGPGQFTAYLMDGFGTPTKWFSSADAPGTDVQTIATGQHTHVNWAFSQPGDYTVTFQGDAKLPDGTPVSTGPVQYSFHVIGVPTTYLTKGHTDIDIGYDDDVFDLGISHGEPEQDFDVNHTVLVALAGAHTTVPANTNFSFLGSPGSDLWILPQVQNTNLLFLGFGAEDIDSGTFTNDQLTVTLKYAAGPGNFFVYLNDGFGNPTEWFSSKDDPGTDVRTIPTGAHTHVNWAFSAPGDYTVILQGDAQLPDSTPVSTGPVYYSFHVVGTNETWINPIPPQLQSVALGHAINLFWPDHQGWILQSNRVSLTATNAWSPYPADGSTNTEGATIEINPGEPNVFFRMVKP